MPANAIIRVVFGDITFPLQKEEWREGEGEDGKCRRNAERGDVLSHLFENDA